MPELKKVLRLNKKDYFEVHLSLINCLLPKKMTPMEIKVIAAFMALEGDIATYRFGSSAKKIVMNELKLSPASLSNFLKQLKDKKFIVEQEDKTSIWPILIPEDREQMYMFKLIREDEK